MPKMATKVFDIKTNNMVSEVNEEVPSKPQQILSD